MQIYLDEDFANDYSNIDYYLYYKYEATTHWLFIHRYDSIEAARKGIENHKVAHTKKHGSDKKITYRIMQLTKDIKFIYK